MEKLGVVSDYCVRVRCSFFPRLSAAASLYCYPHPTPPRTYPSFFIYVLEFKVEVLFLQFAFTHPKTFLDKVATVLKLVRDG